MPVACQPSETVGQIVGQPGVDGIGIARLQQAVAGHRMRRRSGGDLQQRRTALAHIRARVVVACLLQFPPLRPTQG